MTEPSSSALLILVRGLRLGPLRLTEYGTSATVGVLLGMALSGRSARRVGIASEAAWDTGLFAVICCFVTSRLLLVLHDPVAFAKYPLLVLGLPSLTFGGLALAGALVALYVRRKRLPLLHMLDLFAPSGALLAALLELGHAADGSEPGMPLSFWRYGRGGLPQPVHLYPVALVGAAVSLALAALLFWQLPRWKALPGRVAALGLMSGAAAALGLAMLTLPTELLGSGPLEPGESVALGALLAGAFLWQLGPHAGELPAAMPRARAERGKPLKGFGS